MSMSQISAGLLFLHGHIADPALAAALAQERTPTPTLRKPAMDLFKSLMYLGGRPMHPGHNFDIDEPFEPSFGNDVASGRLFGRTRTEASPIAPDGAQATPASCLPGCG